jgi:hypothetical protein
MIIKKIQIRDRIFSDYTYSQIPSEEGVYYRFSEGTANYVVKLEENQTIEEFIELNKTE